MNGDTVVALLGVVMAAAILAQNTRLRHLPVQRKVTYAAVWIALFAVGAWLTGRFSG